MASHGDRLAPGEAKGKIIPVMPVLFSEDTPLKRPALYEHQKQARDVFDYTRSSNKVTKLTKLLVSRLVGKATRRAAQVVLAADARKRRLNDSAVSTSDIEEATHSHLAALNQYSLRILASRIYPTMESESFHVVETIKKRLAARVHDRRARQQVWDAGAEEEAQQRTGLEDAGLHVQLAMDDVIRFEELHAKLVSSELPKRKWAVVYLLWSLSADSINASNAGEAFAHGSVNAPVDAPFMSFGALPETTEKDQASAGGADTSHVHNKQSQLTVPTWEQELVSKREQAQKRRAQIQKTVADNLSYEVPESVLLRDIIYTFQGIDGKYIKYDSGIDAYAIVPHVGVPAPVRDLTRRVCELGWMYRHTCEYVNNTMDSPVVGLVEQSFCGGLQHELTEYYRLIAVLESQLTENLELHAPSAHKPHKRLDADSDTESEVSQSTTDDNVGSSEHAFSLRRLFVWIQDPLERLRLMTMLADTAQGMKGGALASAIAAFLQHGDAMVLAFIKRIMTQLCKPIFHMIKKWVTTGELEDPYGEFFVSSDASVPDEKLWHSKYSLRTSMIPSFVSLKLANKILVIGKSINFIRYCCEESEWVSESKLSFALEYGSGDLHSAIEEAAEITNKRLLSLMLEKFRFQEHCFALKKYLLLGQGDFIQLLLDSLYDDLGKSAKNIYRHNLMNTLEQAIRGSNAQYEDPDILKRLSVRLLKYSEGDFGWDVFSLDYLTDTPLNVVFTERAINKYLRVFNFLWRLKRVSFILSETWGRNHSRDLLALPGLGPAMHRGLMLRNEMNHFVCNLHSYMMFEVMECAWTDLVESVQKAADLDQVIIAHDNYLKQIVNKALMGGAKSKIPVLGNIIAMFDLIAKFGFLQRRIWEAARDELQSIQKLDRGALARSKKGKWGLSGTEEQTHDSKLYQAPQIMASNYLRKLHSVEKLWRDLWRRFHEQLSKHPSPDLRFLRLRLDFNEYYGRQEVAMRAAQKAQAQRAAAENLRRPKSDHSPTRNAVNAAIRKSPSRPNALPKTSRMDEQHADPVTGAHPI